MKTYKTPRGCEYIETIECNGHMVNVFLDNCGQCYYLQYINEDGFLREESCGTYNTYYQDQIEYMFDYESWAKKYMSKEEMEVVAERSRNQYHKEICKKLLKML